MRGWNSNLGLLFENSCPDHGSSEWDEINDSPRGKYARHAGQEACLVSPLSSICSGRHSAQKICPYIPKSTSIHASLCARNSPHGIDTGVVKWSKHIGQTPVMYIAREKRTRRMFVRPLLGADGHGSTSQPRYMQRRGNRQNVD